MTGWKGHKNVSTYVRLSLLSAILFFFLKLIPQHSKTDDISFSLCVSSPADKLKSILVTQFTNKPQTEALAWEQVGQGAYKPSLSD